MIKDGKKVEKKSMVCSECVTLMTPTDYKEHNGVCQLCRGGNSEATLFAIYYTYEDDSEPCIQIVASTDTEDDVEQRFRDEHDASFDYVFVEEIRTASDNHLVYDVVLRMRD